MIPCASINPLAQTSRVDLNGPLGGGDVARDQDNARDVGLATRPRQEIVERLARGHFARRDVRHRIVAGPAQRRGGLDIVAIIVAGQERDGDVGAGSEMVTQFRDLMPARGDFD